MGRRDSDGLIDGVGADLRLTVLEKLCIVVIWLYIYSPKSLFGVFSMCMVLVPLLETELV